MGMSRKPPLSPEEKAAKLLYERELYYKLREQRLIAGDCVKCGEHKAILSGTRCDVCRNKRQSYRKKARVINIVASKCINCGRSPTSETSKGFCEECRLHSLACARERAFLNKALVMAHYGHGKCCCCDANRLDFLTIDHVDGNGAEHRREYANTNFSGEKFYLWLINSNFPPGYQALCFNCNSGRDLNEGICPHHGTIPQPITTYQFKSLQLKTTVMNAYGGACNCCNETILQFLNMDHIDGRENPESDLTGNELYRWLVKNNFPKDFQALCFNCNISKHLSEICVHMST